MISVRKLGDAVRAVLSPRANIDALRECVGLLLKHRRLTIEMTKRDLGGQYAGQILGWFWLLGNPIILFAVYIFVFGVVLKTRIDQSFEMPRDYTTYILAGIAPWLSLQQALARAPTTLIAQANLVKQVVFPIEVLPVGAIINAAIPLLMGLTLLLLRMFVMDGTIPATVLLLPLAGVLHAAAMLGFAYALAAVTPFFRDIKDVVQAMTVIGVYLVPAFYLPSWIPELLRPWLYLNPFSYIIWMYQDILYYGAIRHPWAWVVSALIALVGLALGYRIFRRLKPFVANVL